MSAAVEKMSALLAGGDWACSFGDVGTVAYAAELLAACVADPLRRELLEVARACHAGDEHAGERWHDAREHVRITLIAP
jgi:hypothetical protein